MSEVYVIGVGQTPFGRFPNSSVRALAAAAARAALADAGCTPDRIEAVFFANAGQGAMDGQHSIRGQLALRDFRFGPIPVVNVENACAGAATAFNMAVAQIRAGLAEIVLAAGAEKLSDPDRTRSMAVFDGSWDVHDVAGNMARLMRMGDGVETPAALRPTSMTTTGKVSV